MFIKKTNRTNNHCPVHKDIFINYNFPLSHRKNDLLLYPILILSLFYSHWIGTDCNIIIVLLDFILSPYIINKISN